MSAQSKQFMQNQLKEGYQLQNKGTLMYTDTYYYRDNQGNVTQIEINFETGKITMGEVKTEKRMIGDTVSYSPSGSYTWQAEYYASSDEYSDVLLDSSTEDYKIATWKILDVDGDTITLVPSEPTKGTVPLQGIQGYNNAVLLLNQACSDLYGDEDNKITARSINVEDIYSRSATEALEDDTSVRIIDGRVYGVLSTVYTNKVMNYPTIYGLERFSTINGVENTSGLSTSEQYEFINRDNQKSVSSEPISAITFTSIPNRLVAESSLVDLLYSNHSYLFASRAIGCTQPNMFYSIMAMNNGNGSYKNLNMTAILDYSSSGAMFPVVTLNASMVTDWDGLKWNVQLPY